MNYPLQWCTELGCGKKIHPISEGLTVTHFPYRHCIVDPCRKTRTAFPTVLLRLRSIRALHAIWALVCALLIPSSSIAAEPPTDLAHFPHPVWDAKHAPSADVFTYFYWVDDDTILFRAETGLKPRTEAERNVPRAVLYLWHLEESPKIYTDGYIGYYCAANGWVYVPKFDFDPRTGTHGRARVVVEGPLGQEQERPLPPPEPAQGTKDEVLRAIRARGGSGQDPRRIDAPDKCLPPPADPALSGQVWLSDTYRQYRIIFGLPEWAWQPGKGQVIRPLELMRSDGSGRTTLPITTAEVDPNCTQFHRFDRLFLIWDCSNAGLIVNGVPAAERWHAKHDCWPVWQVDPSTATTEKICLPYGNWVGSIIELVPTKAGLLFATLNDAAEYPNGPGAAGLYELTNGTARRILTGLIRWPTVSPSGCKVIFDYAEKQTDRFFGYPGSPTVIAINLCSPKPTTTNS